MLDYGMYVVGWFDEFNLMSKQVPLSSVSVITLSEKVTRYISDLNLVLFKIKCNLII